MCLFLSPFVPCRTQLRHGRSALLAIKFALEDSRPGSRARSNLHLMDGSQKASVPTVRQTVKPPGKPDGPCFSPVSIFLLPIGQVLIMWNRTLSQLIWLGPSLRTQLTLHPSCNLPTPLGPLHGKLSHRSKKHRDQATGMPLSSL